MQYRWRFRSTEHFVLCFLCKEQSINYSVYYGILLSSYNQKLNYFQFGPLTCKCSCLLSVPLKTSPTCNFKHNHKWAKPPSPAGSLVLFKQRCLEWWEVCSFTEGPWFPLVWDQRGCLAQEVPGVSLQSSGSTSPFRRQSNSLSSVSDMEKGFWVRNLTFFLAVTTASMEEHYAQTLHKPQLVMAQAKQKFLQM